MRILGTKVHSVTLPQALKRAEGFLYDGKQHHIVTPNPEIVLRARRDARYRLILNNADLSLPDGSGLVWASRCLFGKPKGLRGRVAGVDFMQAFLRHVSYNSHRTESVLLLGGRRGVARATALKLQKRFHGFRFYAIEDVHSRNVDFTIGGVISPDLVFVGLGAPKQEKWIHKNLSRYPTVKIAMGVGGAFDIISGRIPRAPMLFRQSGLEWFWRLLREPWRARRIYNAAVVFSYQIFMDKRKR